MERNCKLATIVTIVIVILLLICCLMILVNEKPNKPSPLAYYQKYPGDCKYDDDTIKSYQYPHVTRCLDECDRDNSNNKRGCAGVSYNPKAHTCVTRKKACKSADLVNDGYTFYRAPIIK